MDQINQSMDESASVLNDSQYTKVDNDLFNPEIQNNIRKNEQVNPNEIVNEEPQVQVFELPKKARVDLSLFSGYTNQSMEDVNDNFTEISDQDNMIEAHMVVEHAFSEALVQTFATSKDYSIDVKQIPRESIAKNKQEVIKKGWIKDEKAVVPVHEINANIRGKKRENAKRISDSVYGISDKKAMARVNASVQAKAAVSEEDMELLSQFVPALEASGSATDLSALAVSYGDAKDTEGRMVAFDIMTEQIMKINVEEIDLTSDDIIAQNAEKLENIACMTKAYKKLLSNNPSYVNGLKEKKDDSGLALYEQLKLQLSILNAVSDYYRVRKMIIEDPLYVEGEKDIFLMERDGDTPAEKRLKRMLRTSYQLADNLNIVTMKQIEAPDLLQGMRKEGKAEQKDEKLVNLDKRVSLRSHKKEEYDAVEADIEQLLKGFEDEALELPEKEMIGVLSLKSKKNLSPAAYRRRAAFLMGADEVLPSIAKSKLTDRQKELYDLLVAYREQSIVDDMKQRVLSDLQILQIVKCYSKGKTNHEMLEIVRNQNIIYTSEYKKNTEKLHEAEERIREKKEDLRNRKNQYDVAITLPGGNSNLVRKKGISDYLDHKDRIEEEIKQLEHKVRKYKKNPDVKAAEAVAASGEARMKQAKLLHEKRFLNATGSLIFVLHPTDLMTQMTDDMLFDLSAANESPAMKNMMERVSLFGNGLRAFFNGNVRGRFTQRQIEFFNRHFGRMNTIERLLEWYQTVKDQPEVKTFIKDAKLGDDNGLNKQFEDRGVFILYFYMHPELITTEMLNAHGDYSKLHRKSYKKEDVRDLIRKLAVKTPSVNEIGEYKRKLAEKNAMKLTDEEADPYGLSLFEENLHEEVHEEVHEEIHEEIHEEQAAPSEHTPIIINNQADENANLFDEIKSEVELPREDEDDSLIIPKNNSNKILEDDDKEDEKIEKKSEDVIINEDKKENKIEDKAEDKKEEKKAPKKTEFEMEIKNDSGEVGHLMNQIFNKEDLIEAEKQKKADEKKAMAKKLLPAALGVFGKIDNGVISKQYQKMLKEQKVEDVAITREERIELVNPSAVEEFKVVNGKTIGERVYGKMPAFANSRGEYFYDTEETACMLMTDPAKMRKSEGTIRTIDKRIPGLASYMADGVELYEKLDKMEKDPAVQVPGELTDGQGNVLSSEEIEKRKEDDTLYNMDQCYELTGVPFTGVASTNGGSTSASMSCQLAYRGIHLDQKEIRRYVPEQASYANLHHFQHIGNDSMPDMEKYSELMNRFKSNMVTHTVTGPDLSDVTEENEKEMRMKAAVELAYFRRTIIDAIVKHRSPVTMHFISKGDRMPDAITIFAIEGNKVKYYAGKTIRKDGIGFGTLTDLMSAKMTKLVWFEELKPTAENEADLIKDQVEGPQYKDGKLEQNKVFAPTPASNKYVYEYSLPKANHDKIDHIKKTVKKDLPFVGIEEKAYYPKNLKLA